MTKWKGEGKTKRVGGQKCKSKRFVKFEKIASNLVNNKNFISKTKNNNYLPILSNLENNLISIFGTKVQIRKNNKDKGKISISFFSNDDLNRIIELISKIK